MKRQNEAQVENLCHQRKKAGPRALPFKVYDVSGPLFFELSPQPHQAQQAGAQEPDGGRHRDGIAGHHHIVKAGVTCHPEVRICHQSECADAIDGVNAKMGINSRVGKSAIGQCDRLVKNNIILLIIDRESARHHARNIYGEAG